MSRRFLVALLTGLLALAAAPAAEAVTFSGQVIDGPSADLTSTGSLDLARDGSGGIAYVKAGRVWVASTINGAWSPAAPIDTGVPAGATDVHLAAAGGGALVVAWVAGGRVWAAYRPPLAAAFGAPVPVYGASADGLSLDLSVNLKGFLAFHAAGNVRVARLVNGVWSLDGQFLDAHTSDDAGAATGRPDVAVASDGTAIVVWGENGVVYARRVRGAHVSTAVVAASVPSLDGYAAANADLPSVGVGDDDSIAVVVFRQAFAVGSGTVSRVLGRRLRGSAFDDATPVDGLGFGGESAGRPSIAMAGNTHGIAVVSRSSGQVWAAPIDLPGSIEPAGQADLATSAADPEAVGAVAEHTWAYVVSRRATATDSEVVARPKHTNGDDAWQPEVVLSDPSLGPIDPDAGVQAASDDANDLLAAFVQGSGADRRLVVGGIDFPPGRPSNLGPTDYQKSSRPRLIWKAGAEDWGPRWAVTVDGLAAGTAYVNRFRPAAPLADGTHTYQVTEYDRRGQVSAPSRVGTFRIDTRPPAAKLRLGGSTRAGKATRARATASDGPVQTGGAGTAPTAPPGSGVATVRISFGDHTKARTITSGHTVRHTYRKAGRYTVTLKVTDVAGNTTKVTKRVRIKHPPKHKTRTKPKPKTKATSPTGGGASP